MKLQIAFLLAPFHIATHAPQDTSTMQQIFSYQYHYYYKKSILYA